MNMAPEIQNLIAKVKEPGKVARLLDHVANRLDEIVAERRRASTERRKVDDGGTDGR